MDVRRGEQKLTHYFIFCECFLSRSKKELKKIKDCMINFKVIAAGILCFLLTACEDLAIIFTPQKKPLPSNSKLAKVAENQFWDTLHKGKYNNIANTNRLLMAAYLENPNNPQLAAHIGFLHIWQITERQRNKDISPTIVDDIILSSKYFSDAVQLAPQDARYLGFYGDSLLIEGKIFHDERQQTRGYFTLKRAMKMWPEFNYFTAGYVMSSLPAQSDYFKKGLQWQWETLDLCAMQHVSRQYPDFLPYMKYETTIGKKRACWNSWIAPYNFEGFFLNMGDMLVKSGDWQTAIIIYRNAKLASNYKSWPYRAYLEGRISNAERNVKNFQHDQSELDVKNHLDSQTQKQYSDTQILFNSGYGCMACHQSGY